MNKFNNFENHWGLFRCRIKERMLFYTAAEASDAGLGEAA